MPEPDLTRIRVLRQTLRRRFRLRLTAKNMGSVLITNVVNRATSFIVYALVARALGAEELGRLALTVSIFMMFSRFTVLGVTTVATRDVARDRDATASLLIGTSAIAVAGSAVGYVAMMGIVSLLGYQPATAAVAMILFTGLLPFSLTQVNQALFIGREEAHSLVWTTAPINIAQTVMAGILLSVGAGVREIAWTIVGAHTAQAVLQVVLFASRVSFRRSWKASEVKRLLIAGLPFLGIHATNAVASSGTIIVLSAIGSETDVGLLSAAHQIIVPVALVSQATAAAAYPVMSRRVQQDRKRLRDITRRAIEAIQTIVTPAVTGLMVLAAPIIVLVYGPELAGAADLLRILAFSALGKGLTSVLGQVLWATDRETTSLRIGVINAALVLGASYTLIATLGLIGAAWSGVLVTAVNIAQHWIPLRHELRASDVAKATWKAILASVTMAFVILAIPDVNIIVRIVLGMIVYGAALATIYRVEGRNSLGRLVIRAD